jgi:hypothetical protein
MRLALPSQWIDSRARLLRLREATKRALPYLLIALAMLGYLLIAIGQEWF